LRFFDPQKIILLFTIYEQKEEQLWQKAFIGFFLSLLVHGKRVELYPEIFNRIKAYSSDDDFSKQIEQIVIQFLKSKETEKISKKIREDILPHMMKIKTKLDEKLDLDNILSVEQFEDKNPEWKKVFEDTPDLYDKFEEFSMMQMEGSDVFLSAFAMLKRFPFFNKMSNWFVPFYHQNEVLKDIIQEKEKEFDTAKFVEGIERSAFLCNSDKYSFCLNIKYMPTLQKSMMLEMFNMEMKAMNEVNEEDEKLNKDVKSKKVYTQYFQDLYRFYKLHPLKNEFEDVFDIDIELDTNILLKYLVNKEEVIRNIAEYYFEKEYFDKALLVFLSLAEKENSQELFEKIGYAYQKQNNIEKAIEYYQRAMLFDNEKNWLLKKLAFCNRKLKRFDEALKLYKRLEKNNQEDFHTQANLGHTYMELENYEEAQKYYFKVEYLAKDNFKVFRPIAWSSFVMGKFDTAKKYFEKVIKKEPTADDYLNLGHVEWCTGNAKAAVENYKVAKEKAKNDAGWLFEQFMNDKPYLEKHGIKDLDIKLMEDYIGLSDKIE
jgi:tetratricopeptide (TPR) repeat protein